MSNRFPSVAVFVSSADTRRDVLNPVLLSVQKFWWNIPYPLYVGLNTLEKPLQFGIPVLVTQSEWHGECAHQLAQVEQTYLIMLLDDYLLRRPVDQVRLSELVEIAIRHDLDYLRLTPLGRSLRLRLSGKFVPECDPEVERIDRGHPFYSGLQIAVWRKAHLESLLAVPRSIWDFEKACPLDSKHYAIRDRPPFAYRHLVERGRWLPDARALLRQAGLPCELGSRAVWPRSRYLGFIRERVKWFVHGYSNC